MSFGNAADRWCAEPSLKTRVFERSNWVPVQFCGVFKVCF